MVTQAQKDQFVSTYASYAKQASAKLGVDGNVILAQWANETGWGTNRGATQLNNLGGVNVPGGQGEDYQGFSNPQDFTNSYVSTIQRKYPQAVNTGSDANAFVTGLTKGSDGKSYFTSDVGAYQSTVSSISSSLASSSNYQTASPEPQPAMNTIVVRPTPDSGAASPGSGGTGPGTGSPTTGGGSGADSTSKAGSSAPTATPTPSTQALKDMMKKWLQPNPLNKYWQPTYHFRLFMAGDQDLLDQVGLGAITEVLRQVNGNKISQVVIAETGVTGYNIKEVEIHTVDSMNPHTRQQQATEITMTITEPLGISFLDAIAGASTMLGIWDYTKTAYFLQLSFTGYNEDGSFASDPLPFEGFQNGGQWLYALTIDTIDTKLNEGGGVYTIRFVTTETVSVISEDKAFKTAQVVAPEGKTVGELFDNYTTRLNAAWADEYGKSPTGQPLMKFKIKVFPVLFKGDQYYGKNPADFKLKPQKPDINPMRSLAMTAKGSDGTQVVTVPQGMSTNDFISAAIMSTEEGQAVFKDEQVIGQPDMSASQTNSQRRRVSKMFSIEPDVKAVAYDKQTGRYVQEVVFNVTPTYYNGAILSRRQVDDAAKPEVQRQMIQSLGDNGFLRKQYDYIFTGLNTEVLDFDISFNFTFQPMLPKAAGFRMTYVNNANHARTQEKLPPPVSSVLQIKDLKKASSSVPSQANATKAQNANPYLKALVDQNQAKFGVFPQASPTGAQTPPSLDTSISNILTRGSMTSPPPAVNATTALPDDTSGGKRYYIEDVLSRLNQGQTTNLILPISFNHGYLEFVQESSPGINGQYHPDRPLAATVMVQRLTNNFMDITITIRGDPFWLGQTNVERQILLRAGKAETHDPTALPNFITGNPNIIIYFRYPLQLGDEFKPILKDSAAFNGVYQVTEVKHTFSEGTFKQVLSATRSILVDIGQAMSTDVNAKTNDQGSSADVSENNNAAGANTADGTSTPGTGGSTIAPSGGLPNSQTQRDRAQESYNFWTNKGYSPAAASGMVAQEEAETGFDWTQTGDGGAAKGAFQWHGDRQAAILAGTGINVADPNTTHEQQLQAAYWEQTQGGETRAGNLIRAATDGGEAGALGSKYYERPANGAVQAQQRGGRGAFWQTQFAPTKTASN